MPVDKDFIFAAILEIQRESTFDLEVLHNLFAAGLDLVYLRTNLVNDVNWVRIIAKINPTFSDRIIIPASSRAFGLKSKLIGHWKEAARKEHQPDMFLSDKVYSTSVHYLTDILDLPACFRYVFYSPVFPSISKPGYNPQIDLVTLKQDVIKLCEKKAELPQIIALGGIQAENVKEVKDAGFDGVALMGALWQSADPVQAFKEIKKALIS